MPSSNQQAAAAAATQTSSYTSTKRGKAKKAADPINTSKQIEDTIALLEKNKAGDKEQEMEIEREVKKATRDLNNLLSNLDPNVSRADTLQRKYSELLADMKRVEREHIKSKKRADQLQKEKDASRSELTKMTSTKDKLEKLCREMQRENKKLKDENRQLRETETRMREELHQRLESMVADVQEVIDQKEHPESIPANMETDELFRHKFKSFIDQYEMRELQFHSLLRTKELEVQYQLARYEQQRKAQEQEASKSRQLTSQVSTFSQTETELRSQLNIYVEKFKQVEDTLNNSNDLFLTFRREMEEMSKKTKRLEKENAQLTRRHEATNQNILQMAEDRTKTGKEIENLRREKEKLEKLCRGMQAQGRGVPPPLVPPSQPSQPGVSAHANRHNHQQHSQPHHHHHHHHHHSPHANGGNHIASAQINGAATSGRVGQNAGLADWEHGEVGETESDYEDEYDEDLSGEDEGDEVYSDEGDVYVQDPSLATVQVNGGDHRITSTLAKGPAAPPPVFGPPPPPPTQPPGTMGAKGQKMANGFIRQET